MSAIVSNVSCELKEDTSIIDPIVEISDRRITNWSNINYMYIAEFGRYYFIQDVSYGVGGVAYVRGHVDVLMSNANAIYGLTCLISRQEFQFNRYFSDKLMPVRVNAKYVFKNVGALPNAKTNVLTVDGGAITAN